MHGVESELQWCSKMHVERSVRVLSALKEYLNMIKANITLTTATLICPNIYYNYYNNSGSLLFEAKQTYYDSD